MTITNSSSNPFDLKASEDLSTPPSNPETGGGGGDMGVWSFSDYELVTTITQTTYTNESSYTIPPGVFTNPNNPFNKSERTVSTPENSLTLGYLGGDMAVWTDYTRTDKLRTLTTTTYTNQSSYTIPAGLVDSFGFNLSFEDGEHDLSEPTRGALLGVNFYGLVISGEVRAIPSNPGDDPDPLVVPDATVTAQGPGQGYTTEVASDGSFQIEVGVFGTWRLVASREYLADGETTIDMSEQSTEGVDLTLGIPSGGGGVGLQVVEGAHLG